MGVGCWVLGSDGFFCVVVLLRRRFGDSRSMGCLCGVDYGVFGWVVFVGLG